MQPQNCNDNNNGGSSTSSPDDHMQQDQKLAVTTATGTASSPLMKFPPSLHDGDRRHHDHHHHHFHQMQQGFEVDQAPPPHDDFLEQMLSSLNSASSSGWDLKAGGENDPPSPEDESENGVSAAGFPFGSSAFDSFHPAIRVEENQMAGLFNGSFVGSLLGGSSQQMNLPHDHFQSTQVGGPGFEVPTVMNNNTAPVTTGSAGAGPAQPKQRVRARRGQATDPHSIAERLRRERIAERMKGLQELVPNANKTDKASMLDEIIEYVKFLQLQVKVLSMSRLGGAGVNPPVGDNISSEGAGDSFRARARAIMRRGGSNGELTATSTEEATANNSNNNNTAATTAVNENQVAKLMEEDMGSAMQYLQSKGLCLMPISLAAAISTAKNPLSSSSSTKHAGTNGSPLTTSNGNGPVSR